MKRILLILAVSALCCISASIFAQPATRNKRDETAIRAVLDAQAVAWNRGDVEGYMDGYERSENTVFISGDRINRGWQTVLERYKKSYDTREKMGVLTFSDLEITILSKNAALAVGRWRLKRANDERTALSPYCFGKAKPAGGSFTITRQVHKHR